MGVVVYNDMLTASFAAMNVLVIQLRDVRRSARRFCRPNCGQHLDTDIW